MQRVISVMSCVTPAHMSHTSFAVRAGTAGAGAGGTLRHAAAAVHAERLVRAVPRGVAHTTRPQREAVVAGASVVKLVVVTVAAPGAGLVPAPVV